MHTSYTVGITTGEYKALQYVMIDQKDWIENAIKNRARIASDEIVNLYRGFFGKSLLSGSLVEPRRPNIDANRIVTPSAQTSFTFDANRVVSPQTQNTQTVDPGLLGNNPSNILKNLQIRSRTQ